MRLSVWVFVMLLHGIAGAQAAVRREVVVVPYFPLWYYDHPYSHPGPLPPRRRLPPPPQPEPAAAPMMPSSEPSYWYCLDAKVYYPEVTRCPGGWQQVVPRSLPLPPVK